MYRKILLRIFSIIPTIFFISIVLFFLSKSVPLDSVDKLMSVMSSQESTDLSLFDKKYNQLSSSLGFDKPLFYFGIYPKSYPDTLFKIQNEQDNAQYKRLIHQFPNSDLVNQFLNSREIYLTRANAKIQAGDANARTTGYNILRALMLADSKPDIQIAINRCSSLNNIEADELDQVRKSFEKMINDDSKFRFMPKIKWYGFDNQYHRWLTKVISGDFGISLRDGRPVTNKIRDALKWTLTLNGIALILALFFSITLGTYLGAFATIRVDQIFSSITYIFYAIPIFWLATLLVVFFTTEEYGFWTNIFPSVGMFLVDQQAGVLSQFFQNFSKLILPILCIVLTSMAYLTRQMRASIKEQMDLPYVEYLQAKGLSLRTRVIHHILPNAIFPMITLISLVVPFLFSGSIVIEYIFNIPGMGRLLMDSILFQDWPVVFIVVLLFSLITILSFLLADLLYVRLDPRLRTQKD